MCRFNIRNEEYLYLYCMREKYTNFMHVYLVKNVVPNSMLPFRE